MAATTTDYFIHPEDGWIEVAAAPTNFITIGTSDKSAALYLAFSASAPAGDTFATGTLTFTGQPTAADTVTVGNQTYTFVSSLTGANQVLIGVADTNTAANLSAAINAGAGSGTTYGAGTVKNALASAGVVSLVVTVTARAPGLPGNKIALSQSTTGPVVAVAAFSGGAYAIQGVPIRCWERPWDQHFNAAISANAYVRVSGNQSNSNSPVVVSVAFV